MSTLAYLESDAASTAATSARSWAMLGDAAGVTPSVMLAVQPTLLRLIDLTQLDEGWDGADGLPPSGEAMANVYRLLTDVRRLLVTGDLTWKAPRVTPSPDGGVDLCWRVDDRYTLLIFRHDQVVCVTRQANGTPTRQVESVGDAVQQVRWVLGAR